MRLIRNTSTLTKALSVALFGVALIATPVFANNGKGDGNGGGHGNGNGNGNGSSHSARTSDGDNDQGSGSGLSANHLGKLNGFLHASPSALKHASPKSAIGKVVAYGGLLDGFLTPEQGKTPPTLAQLAAALAAATNKPLTPAVIKAVNAKLAAIKPDLAKAISGYSGGASGLADDISKAAAT
ncbi:hypothetical protein [Labrys neptuniae]